jgi:hypothetical protein
VGGSAEQEHNLPYWVNLCRGPRRGMKTWTDQHGEGLCPVLHPPSVQICSAASDSFYGSDTPHQTPQQQARDVFEREGSKSLITHSRPLDQASSDFVTSSIADVGTRPPNATDRTDDDLAVAGPSSSMAAAAARPPSKGRCSSFAPQVSPLRDWPKPHRRARRHHRCNPTRRGRGHSRHLIRRPGSCSYEGAAERILFLGTVVECKSCQVRR